MDSLGSQSSSATHDSITAAGGTETLQCGNREIQPIVPATVNQTTTATSSGYHWTLSNWGAQQATRRRNNSNTVRVDLASPEDISLDTDNSTRVVFSAYGTTV